MDQTVGFPKGESLFGDSHYVLIFLCVLFWLLLFFASNPRLLNKNLSGVVVEVFWIRSELKKKTYFVGIRTPHMETYEAFTARHSSHVVFPSLVSMQSESIRVPQMQRRNEKYPSSLERKKKKIIIIIIIMRASSHCAITCLYPFRALCQTGNDLGMCHSVSLRVCEGGYEGLCVRGGVNGDFPVSCGHKWRKPEENPNRPSMSISSRGGWCRPEDESDGEKAFHARSTKVSRGKPTTSSTVALALTFGYFLGF